MKTPKYRKHTVRNLGFIETKGKRIYFPGEYNSPDSLAAYYSAISDLVSGNEPKIRTHQSDVRLTVAQVCALYEAKRKDYHGRHKFYTVRSAMDTLSEAYGSMAMLELEPHCLVRVQELMQDRGLSRRYINECISYLKVVVRWARLMGHATAEQVVSLDIVENLQPNKSKAREPEKISPVEESVVLETVKYVRPAVRNLILFMLHTGCRPGEARVLTPGQIDRGDDIWVYRPLKHKTQHRGKSRAIPVGPKAKSIIVPQMFRGDDAYCFPSNEKRNRCYSKDTLNQAIERGVEKANEVSSDNGNQPITPWNANQLRHTVATRLRDELGIEAAQKILGHSSLRTTEIYAEVTLEQAKKIARKLG